MKFIPILFSTPMVQAILKGRKTMTRRKIKLYKADEYPLRQTSQWMQENNTCPYGKVGDVLWVRETFCLNVFENNPYLYKADDNDGENDYLRWKPSLFMPKAACRIFLVITDIRVERLQHISKEDAKKEGIEFTIADKEKFRCRATGMKLYRDYERKDNSLTNYPCNGFENAIVSFETLWQSINGKESWEANPWVWVIVFERIEKPADTHPTTTNQIIH